MSWDNLLTYDQIGRVALIAIMATPNILIPFTLSMMIHKLFVKFLECFIDRQTKLLIKLSTGEDEEEKCEDNDDT